jgi:putative oxidoreductase
MQDARLIGRMVNLYDTACRQLEHARFLPPLLGRVVIAAVFIPSGWGKLHSLPDVINFFTSLGIPFPEYQAPFVAAVELVCGLLVLVGLGTRLASLMLLSTMVVAVVTAIWPDVTGVADFFAKDEVVYAAILGHLIVMGGGAVAADGALASITVGTPGQPALSPNAASRL